MARDIILLNFSTEKEEFFHKLIYKTNFKKKTISKGLFLDLDKLILKFIGGKMQEYSKCFLKNSKKGLALPDKKTCNKMVVSKAMWYCHSNKINKQ